MIVLASDLHRQSWMNAKIAIHSNPDRIESYTDNLSCAASSASCSCIIFTFVLVIFVFLKTKEIGAYLLHVGI